MTDALIWLTTSIIWAFNALAFLVHIAILVRDGKDIHPYDILFFASCAAAGVSVALLVRTVEALPQ